MKNLIKLIFSVLIILNANVETKAIPPKLTNCVKTFSSLKTKTNTIKSNVAVGLVIGTPIVVFGVVSYKIKNSKIKPSTTPSIHSTR